MHSAPPPVVPARRDALATTPPRLAAAGYSAPAHTDIGGMRGVLQRHFHTWWPVWLAFALSRLGVLAIGALAQYAAQARGIGATSFATAGTFVHYADVVQHGYTLKNATEFPLLPLLLAPLAQLGLPLPVAALLVANLAFLIGLLAFAAIGARYIGVTGARRAALYLAIFPTAYWFSLASTESVMLASLGLAVLFATRGTTGWWFAAAGAAATCALTRPPAVLVSIVLLAIAVHQLRAGSLSRRGIAAAALAVSAPAIAVIGFFSYLHFRTGDFFASVHAQSEFGRSMSLDGPWRAVTGAVASVRGGSLGPGFELVAAIGMLAATAWFAWHLRKHDRRLELMGWTLFAAGSIAMPLATGLVWQMPRFALLVPPLFWALALIASRRQWLHTAILVLFPMALAFKAVFEVVGVTR